MDEVDSIGRKNKASGIWKTGCGWVTERCGQEDPAGAKAHHFFDFAADARCGEAAVP